MHMRLQNTSKDREALVLGIAKKEKVLEMFRKVSTPSCTKPPC